MARTNAASGRVGVIAEPSRFTGPLAGWLCLALAALPAATRGAAFEPGRPSDPPTGDAVLEAAREDAEVAGQGIRWAFGPLRWGGRLALDLRSLRMPDGARVDQAALINDTQLSTYIHAPWFVQLQGGLGVMIGRDTTRSPDADRIASTVSALSGNLGVSVFPASRFPFELRADVGDSRTTTDFLGDEYRAYRLSIKQSYRPESSRDLYSLSYDLSRLRSSRWGTDTVGVFSASALRYADLHTFELAASLVTSDRSETHDRTELRSLTGRHAYQPSDTLHVDTLASWYETSFELGGADFSTDLRQISTMAHWRPRERLSWLDVERMPLHVTASARLLDADAGQIDRQAHSQAANVTLGAYLDATQHLRFSAAAAANATRADGQTAARGGLLSGGVNYTPEPLSLGEWRYGPTVALNAGVSRVTHVGMRRALGGQFMHGMTRSAAWDDGSSLSFSLHQSLAALRESETDVLARAVAHTMSLSWQGANTNGSQRFAALTLSEARNTDTTKGYFQLGNLQLSQRLPFTRYSNWSGHLTVQASRSDVTLIDAFTGELRTQSPGWQYFYTGGLGYENHRFFGVPRLRFSLIASASTQQFERRVFGDIDAPRQRVTESIEGRLDYTIGRLDARLSARAARVEGKRVAGIFLRLQRAY